MHFVHGKFHRRNVCPLAVSIGVSILALPIGGWSATIGPKANTQKSTLHASGSLDLPLAGLPSRKANESKPGSDLAGGAKGLHSSPGASVPRGLVTSAGLKSPPATAFGFLPQASARPLVQIRPTKPSTGLVQTKASGGASAPVATVSTGKPLAAIRPALTPQSTGVVLDSSLGQTSQPTTTTNSNGQNDYGIDASMGLSKGGNLYLSFSSFNLATGESATFTGPATVQDILARVTGGSVSSIDGAINCRIPGANIFLLNPAGFVFGPNASLNINGSFVVSTASYMKFADGSRLDALPSVNDAALSGAPVAAFGFTSSTPGNVLINGAQLAVPTGAGVHIVAGNITMQDGVRTDGSDVGTSISAPSGAITLFAAASAGEIPFTLASPGGGYGGSSFPALGTISIANQSILSIDGAGGGAIVIRGGSVTLDNSQLSSANSGLLPGGPISIQADTSVSLLNGAEITSTTAGLASGGAISILTGLLKVDGDNGANGSSLLSESDSVSGSGGSISVMANHIDLTHGGIIDALANSGGQGGDVLINAGGLTIDGQNSSFLTGIFNDTAGSGQGGALSVNVISGSGDVRIMNGGRVSASVYGSGNGGALTLRAGSLEIDGENNDVYGTVVSAEVLPSGSGNAGGVSVQVIGGVSIANGGQISTSSYASGNTGDLTLQAGSLTIAGAGASLLTGVLSSAFETCTGKTGNLVVNVTSGAGMVKITDDGIISTSTYGQGSTGDLTLKANTLCIDGTGADSLTGILSVVILGATGNTGNVTVDVTHGNGNILISDGGKIAASTFDAGNAGNVKILANSLDITVTANPFGLIAPSASTPTGIFAESQVGSTGHAGSLIVDVTSGIGAIALSNGGQISTATFGGGDGSNASISCNSLSIGGFSFLVQNGELIGLAQSEVGTSTQAGATGACGNLTIDVRTGVGNISITGGGGINTTTANDRSGGILYLAANNLTIDGNGSPVSTGISASCQPTGTGRGGDILVDVAGAIQIDNGGQIIDGTFGAGHGGDMTIRGASLTINGEDSVLHSGYITGILTASGSESISASGDAGVATIDITSGEGTISLLDGGQINAATFGHGNAGKLIVNANALLIDSVKFKTATGIFSDAEPNSTGRAGDVVVNVTGGPGSVDIRNIGIITAETFGSGLGGSVNVTANVLSIESGGSIMASTASSAAHGGDVSVNAHLITLDGSAAPELFTGISAVSGSGATGNAGDVLVNASGQIRIFGSAEIDSSTYGVGEGGNVRLSAGHISVSGALSGIFVDSGSFHRGGSAGDVIVDASNSIQLSDGGEISSSTSGMGAGGSVEVLAPNLTITGDTSGIFANSLSAGQGGAAGNVDVRVEQSLQIMEGGSVSSSTLGLGHGGNVNLVAGTISIAGPAGDGSGPSGIFAQSDGLSFSGVGGNIAVRAESINMLDGAQISASSMSTGRAGSVDVVAGNISLSGGCMISTSSARGDAGSITVNASSDFSLLDGSSIAASAGGNGGNITIGAVGLCYLLDSSIVATAGTQRASNGPTGTGGNITIDPQFIVLDHSVISANAAIGRGGNILLQTENYFDSESVITATGAQAGTVDIAAPPLSLTNALVQLSGSLLNASSQLREQCAMLLGQDFSSFLVLGAGGVEVSPDDDQSSDSGNRVSKKKSHAGSEGQPDCNR